MLATGRIVPEEIEHFDGEAQHFYTAAAAEKLRVALDRFSGGRIVIGIAGMPYKMPTGSTGGGLPDRGRAPSAASVEHDRFLLTHWSGITIESVSEMATPIPERKGIELHTFFNVEAIDPERKSMSLEGEELPYDLLIWCRPTRGNSS